MLDGISLIICTYNGKDKLAKTLTAIRQLEVKCNWELLVVDNASTDDTGNVVKELLVGATFDWQLLLESNPGLIHARLCGLRAAKYDVLLYCDDDNTLDKNYVQIGYEILSQNPSLGALGGCGIPVLEIEKPAWFDSYSHSFAVGPQSNEDGVLKEYPAELYGAGTFFRKEPLVNFIDKGFQSVLSGRKGTTLASGEDVEWCYLIQLAGYKIGYDKRLVFEHLLPANRITWDYYLCLKAGIASGTGKMLPYICLFSKGKISNATYIMEWFKKAIFSKIVYYRRLLINFISFRKLKEEEILACLILKSKSDSYFNNPISIYNHFKSLKKII
jgi:glycosyltransferase involved in cell wall biosynthesis